MRFEDFIEMLKTSDDIEDNLKNLCKRLKTKIPKERISSNENVSENNVNCGETSDVNLSENDVDCDSSVLKRKQRCKDIQEEIIDLIGTMLLLGEGGGKYYSGLGILLGLILEYNQNFIE